MDWRLMLTLGAIVNSALYLSGIIAGALVYGSKVVLIAAIMAAGLNYLTYLYQLSFPEDRRTSVVLVVFTIIWGVMVGLLLLLKLFLGIG